MVAALYGKCNGADVVFSFDADAGRWVTTVPASGTNAYVIELWAEDEAGNTAYFATARLLVDTNALCTRFEIVEVGDRFTMEEVKRALAGDAVQTRAAVTEIVCAVIPDAVRSKVVKCEVCGL